MRMAGYAVSQRIRNRAEEIFGWCKTVGRLARTRLVGRLARTRLVGRWKIAQEVLLTLSAYHLVRFVRLEAQP
jgi:hypothetical protein